MSILIGYSSALNYWQSVGPNLLCDYTKRRIDTRKAAKTLNLAIKPSYQLGEWMPYGCTLPLEVLVGAKEARTNTDVMTSRLCSKVPVSSFVSAGRDFYISTPEFCFLQMAQSLSLIQLIRLGFELCGTYSIDENSNMTSRKDSLTSVIKLKVLVESATYISGSEKALQALRYIQNNSASPMETKLVMYLCLPYRLGGYGLPWPHLNYRIDIAAQDSHLADRSFCVCDLAWPDKKLAVEYDSLEYHINPERQASDTSRRTTLAALGWTIVTVSANDVRHDYELNRLASQLSKMTGKRLRYNEHTHRVARRTLRQELSER